MEFNRALNSPASHLSDGEQQEKLISKLEGLREVMAEKFDVAQADFTILPIKIAPSRWQFAVMYAALSGVNLADPHERWDERRSWDGIFKEENDATFRVTLDGEDYDTRLGMTEAVYRAFIAEAQVLDGQPLPDSPQLAEATGEYWTDTWLTGEEADSQNAPAAYVRGDIYVPWVPRGFGGRAIRERRFRPAVVIE